MNMSLLRVNKVILKNEACAENGLVLRYGIEFLLMHNHLNYLIL